MPKDYLLLKRYVENTMSYDNLQQYAQSEAERFWQDAGNHYLNDDLVLLASSQVVEVGGYLGNWADYVSAKYSCYMDVYEPVAEYYSRLLLRFSARPKVRIFAKGVEAYCGEKTIALMGEGSSMYSYGADRGPSVPVVDAAKLVRSHGKLSLLAINAEGAEYPILNRLLHTGEIANINQLLIQFHFKDNVAYPNAEIERNSIREKLAKTHFEVFCYPWVWERWARR